MAAAPAAVLSSSVIKLNFYASPFSFNVVEISTGTVLVQQTANQFTFGGTAYTVSTAANVTTTATTLDADLTFSGTAATAHINFNLLQPGLMQVNLSSGSGASVIFQQFADQGEEIIGGFECPVGPTLSSRNFSHAMAGPLTVPSILNFSSAKAPFYLTTRHYGIYAETDALGTVTFAQGGNTSFSFNASPLIYDIIYGTTYADIMSGFNSRSGGALLPPLWAFDSIWWKDDDHLNFPSGVVNAQGNVLDTANQLANNQIHASAEWIDRPYGTSCAAIQMGWGNMDFDSSFPNPAQMVSDLHARGMNLMLWIADYCWCNLYDEGLANGYLFGTGNATAPNFENPNAYQWFQNKLNAFVNLGVLGYKIDRGDEGELPDSCSNANNTLLQQLAYAGLNAAHPGNGFSFARCVADKGRHYAGVWNGDACTTFAGLQYSILSGLRAGVLNFPMWGSDTGGYQGSNPTEELFARWLQFSAYSTIMEVLVGGGRTPWYDYSANLVAIARAQAAAHHDLIPYTRSALYQATQTGMPVMRPIVFSYPNDPNLATTLTNCEYMFGGQILVAPVISAGASTRDVYLPAGAWLNYNDRATVYTGPATITAPAPEDTIPLFVNQGAIIPRGDVFQGNNLWTANWAAQMRIEFFPADGVTASFPYYTGGPVQNITCSCQSHVFTIQFNDLGLPGYLDVYVRNPGTVTRNGTVLTLGTDYTYTSAKNLLHIPFSGATTLVVNGGTDVFQTTSVAAFTNGSFESGYSAWTYSGNQQISPRASQGANAVQFNPGQTVPDGVLSQTFATMAGQAYTLSFDVGADWGTTTTPQSLLVIVSGNSTLLSKTVTVYGPGNSSSLYTSTNFAFTADAAATTLTFQDVSSTGMNIDLLLDNVQVALSSPPPPPPPSGFTNGSFESGYTGWTYTGNQILSPRASQGTTSVEFNAGQVVPNGVLSQTFATTSGQTYALSFDVGADWGTPTTPQSLQVTVSGNSLLLSKAITVYGPGNSSSLYVSTNFTFTADAAATTLTFKDVSSTGMNIDLLLDNVQVAVSSPPPPPPPPPPSGFANGSFESGYTGWTATGNQQISPRASQGTSAVQFNPGQMVPNGVLSQTFATTSGQTYGLSFDVGADWGTPTTPQSLQVTVSGNSLLLSKTVTVYGPGNSSSLYVSTNFTFTADAAATTLTFQDVSSTGMNIDLLLDNVQVNVTSPTPAAGPFANGSFESGYTGWTYSGNQILSPRASQGSTSVEFNAGQVVPNGILSQTFATTIGQAYALSFDVGADWGTPTTPQSLQVTVLGNNTLLSKVVTVYGPGNSSSLYISTNFTFAADAAATTLTFQDVSSTGMNIDLLLDNVQVNTTVAPSTILPPAMQGSTALNLQLSDDSVSLTCQGALGEHYEIQVSSDLVIWTSVATLEAPNAKALVNRPPAEACQFYRAILLPGQSRSSK
jgi:alpha-glucosidase (family GH31 glycosyl hydrolase)